MKRKMSRERFFDLMGQTDDELLDRAEKYSADAAHLRMHRIIRIAAVAASLCIVIAACIAVPLALRKNKLPIDDPVISDTTDTEIAESQNNENETVEDSAEDTTEETSEDTNEPGSATSVWNPGVYREEDYPDMPATDGLIYMLSPNKDAYYVKGYEGTDSTVYIPETHEGLPVTQIFSWSEGDCLVMTYGAFSENQTIESVFVGKNVEVITSDAFRNCRNLKKIVIPDSVKRIETYAFGGCEALSEIIISDNTVIGTNIYAWKTTAFYNDDSNWIDGMLYVGNHLVRAKNVKGVCTVREGTVDILGQAFADLTNNTANNKITEIIFPESLKNIYARAFYGCTKLEKVTFKGNIEYIDSFAFGECSSLADINIEGKIESLGQNVFENTLYYNSERNWADGVLYVGEYLVAADGALEGHVVIREGTRVISELAFAANDKLLSVTLPKELEVIGRRAFAGCENLFEVYNLPSLDIEALMDAYVMPDNIKKVYTSLDTPTKFVEQDNYMFYCDDEAQEYLLVGYFGGKTKLVLPETVGGKPYEIFYAAFAGNEEIEEIVIADCVTKIDEKSFLECTALKKVTLGAGVEVIGAGAFKNCRALTNVIFNDALKSIEEFAFLNCSALENVTLSEGLESIGDGVFQSCRSFTSVIIPDSVTSMGEGVFENCQNLVTATLPKNITEISAKTFHTCTALKPMVIPSGVKSIGDQAFYGCESFYMVFIPDGMESIGGGAFAYCTKLKEINIPETVTSIGMGAFVHCLNLEEIVLPEGITAIGRSLFAGCESLNKVNIPSSVKVIEMSAFSNCESLKEIDIPNGVEIIEMYAFSDSGITHIDIPDSVHTIGEGAFYKCNALLSIVVGKGVKVVGHYAFEDCYAVYEVYYKGTPSDWRDIEDACGTLVFIEADYIYTYSEEPPTTEGDFWHYVDGVPTAW